jgi:hypothetical protein
MPRPLISVLLRKVVPTRHAVACGVRSTLRDNPLHRLIDRSVSCHEWPVGDGKSDCSEVTAVDPVETALSISELYMLSLLPERSADALVRR